MMLERIWKKPRVWEPPKHAAFECLNLLHRSGV